MKTKSFCLSFELKTDVDEPIFTWLNAHHALECGNSVAFIQNYEYELNFVKEISTELSSFEDYLSRAYILFADEDGQVKGGFVLGKRGENPWNKSVE